MAKYKYQLGNFNLFDYAGVERHLEKMAAKGWYPPEQADQGKINTVKQKFSTN